MSDALSISDLVYRFPDAPPGTVTVHVPRLSLAAGEQMLLTGSSGCGKSTLLNLIAGLLTADAGSIFVAGTDIQSLRGAARDHFRGRHVGMVFQTFNLLQGFSAIENVMLAMMFGDAPPGTHRSSAAALLSQLGLTEAQHNRPADRLSIGQQQRVAVARALACKPALVLADEPTASLDPENAQAAVDLLKSACAASGAALLCVSHDPALPPLFARRASMAELTGPTQHPPTSLAASGVEAGGGR